MPRFRRRRRPRLSWFPILGTNFTVSEDSTRTTLVTFAIPVLEKAINFIEFPLTFDSGQESLEEETFQNPRPVDMTLADFMSSAWQLRRIVGGVYAAYSLQGSGANDIVLGQPQGCAFTVGFMVRRVDESGDVAATNYVDTLNANDSTDPWIWRRTWILGQGLRINRNSAGAIQDTSPIPGAVSDGNRAFGQFPMTNVEYMGMNTGPGVDAKTNRIIGPEERLFIHFATKPLAIQTEYTTNANVTGVYDLRLLGGLRRATNRRNASR